ncbi:DUF3592 domain-containing protein [Roseomonas fluvialis]|uniref:DUF3592 domain-containing protein n=1 Tax=Roseomonas fluvialis TaxID=1750527 RepID=UPI001FCE19AD|nr:DUF3592 domain-containing protein [Roseomonas fluvialis]
MAALSFGLACLIGALIVTQMRDRHALSSRGLRIEAVLERLDHQDHRHGWFEQRRTYYPVFAFTSAQGHAIEAQGRQPVYPPLPVAGQRIQVVYDPENPTLVQSAAAVDAASDWEVWVLAPVAVLSLLLGVVAILWPGRLRRP